MGKRRPTTTPTLRDVLLRQAGRRTVLGVILPVLDGHIAAVRADTAFAGLTSPEIRRGYDALAKQFLTTEYSTTYPNRQLSTRGCFVRVGDRYRLRPKLLAGQTVEDLELLRADLVRSLRDATDRRRADIDRLSATCRMPLDQLDARRQLVEEYLRNFAGNYGENFEIISYAVLRAYFESFGFRIQRFSTTRSNDGGIDYVGGDCIYQVSTDGGLGKLEGDLAKAPGIKRVVVRPEFEPPARERADETAEARIEMADLLTHFVGWLLARDQASKRAKYLQAVLQTALTEFQREDRAEQSPPGP
jgi:hypothetical protein